VQVAVRLGGKSRMDATIVLARFVIFLNDRTNKIR
jgi:hypothetical protein